MFVGAIDRVNTAVFFCHQIPDMRSSLYLTQTTTFDENEHEDTRNPFWTKFRPL